MQTVKMFRDGVAQVVKPGLVAMLGLVAVPGLVAAVLVVGWASRAEAQGAPEELQTPTSETAVWRWQADGLRFETAALPPDRVRSFMAARGFGEAARDLVIDEGCIFRSAIGNLSSTPGAPQITLDQREWRVFVNGEVRRLRMRPDWPAVWDRLNVAKSPRVAFNWALFPPQQRFAPVDYNWGLLSFGLQPGTRFDVEIVWREGDQRRTARFENLECAK